MFNFENMGELIIESASEIRKIGRISQSPEESTKNQPLKRADRDTESRNATLDFSFPRFHRTVSSSEVYLPREKGEREKAGGSFAGIPDVCWSGPLQKKV